jgi:branched-chain amino acid aminotransferase group I
MMEIIYLDGQLMPLSSARLSPFDHGFLYGYGLFETMRAYCGHIFRLDRHLARLRQSARHLGLTHTALHAEQGEHSLETACCKTLEANGLGDARLRLTVSAGEGEMTPDPDSCSRPTVVVTARILTPPPAQKYESGYAAILSSVRRYTRSPLSGMKSTCYTENILARTEARVARCDEAILLNEGGYLTEGSTTNVFVVKSGELITPSLESGVLPGITREAVLELARSGSIGIRERQVCPEELLEADEAFLTNSILELMPLTRFEGKPVGRGKPGPVTEELLAAYRELVNQSVE